MRRIWLNIPRNHTKCILMTCDLCLFPQKQINIKLTNFPRSLACDRSVSLFSTKARTLSTGLLTWLNKPATRSISLLFTCYMAQNWAHILWTPVSDRLWRSPGVCLHTHTPRKIYGGSPAKGYFNRGWGARQAPVLLPMVPLVKLFKTGLNFTGQDLQNKP